MEIKHSLEEEIRSAEKRLEEREEEIKIEISKNDESINRFKNWAWGFVFFGFLVAGLGLFFYLCLGPENYTLNLLGDFYGGSVASIWSLAGLFFIYVAFLGQKQQLLNQQREIMYSQMEVKYTRLELEGQKKEMMEQNKTLRHQRFENTFFQLLKNHQEIVNAMRISQNYLQIEMESSGRDCFPTFVSDFKSKLQQNRLTNLNEVVFKYNEFYQTQRSILSHYFRHLYHLLKIVNNSSDIEEDEKFKYTSIFRAMFSSYEYVLLFYHGLSDQGIEHLKPLLEKYSFLKNIDEDLLIAPIHKDGYEKIAFANSKERAALLAENS